MIRRRAIVREEPLVGHAATDACAPDSGYHSGMSSSNRPSSAARNDRLFRLRPLAVGLIACGAYLPLAWWFAEQKSVTFDETIYAALAQSTRAAGRLDDRLFSLGVAPLPVIVEHLPVAPPTDRGRLLAGTVADRSAVRSARRVTLIVVGCGGVLWVAAWIARRRGLWWGLAAGLLLAWSPTWIAHGTLATTDGALALGTLGAAAALASAMRRPDMPRIALVALAIGVAAGTKYTAVAFVPLGLLPVIRSRQTIVLSSLYYLAIVVAVLWAGHGFEWVERPAPPDQPDRSVAEPAWWTGLVSQYRHQQRGHAAYLCGERSIDGWWSYYPIALVCKSTPAELAVAAIFLAILLRPIFHGSRAVGGDSARQGGDPDASHQQVLDTTPIAWSVLALAVLLVVFPSRVQIGHRYLLPFYPLAILAAVDALARLPAARWRTGLGLALVAVQGVTAYGTAPHFIAYFSPLVGGASAGHRWLGDSNLDWGQDLRTLSSIWHDVDQTRCRLWYFGTAEPRAYSLTAPRFDRSDLAADAPWDHVAISVTMLQGVYAGYEQIDAPVLGLPTRRRLLEMVPRARAGYSIWVFSKEDVLRAMRLEPDAELRSRRN